MWFLLLKGPLVYPPLSYTLIGAGNASGKPDGAGRGGQAGINAGLI